MINAKTAYPTTPSHKVAFLGLGVMGGPMAGHLATAGHRVTVYNRTASKASDWLKCFDGAAASTPAQAGQGAEFVFCCVGNDDDLRAVCLGDDGAFASMPGGSVFVDHTTASAKVARELFSIAQTQAISFIDAPVSGGASGAEDGKLTVMCGGETDSFDQVKDTIAAYASAVSLLGVIGSGQLCKMVNQISIAGAIQALSEALAMGEKAGLDMPKVLEVIGKGAAQSWQMDNRGQTMLADKFDFGFAVEWMRKDLGICLDEARRLGARLPVTALIDQFYADLHQSGSARDDTSSLIKRLR